MQRQAGGGEAAFSPVKLSAICSVVQTVILLSRLGNEADTFAMLKPSHNNIHKQGAVGAQLSHRRRVHQ